MVHGFLPRPPCYVLGRMAPDAACSALIWTERSKCSFGAWLLPYHVNVLSRMVDVACSANIDMDGEGGGLLKSVRRRGVSKFSNIFAPS